MDSTSPHGIHVDSKRTLWGRVKSSRNFPAVKDIHLKFLNGQSDDVYPAVGVFSDSGCNSPVGKGGDACYDFK